MASTTKNVKVGVCQIFYAGQDLGYTQGGVEVSVTTDSHEVNIDQFGKSTINQIILGRKVSVKAPLAETTIENMVKIMPGASLVATAGIQASGTVTPAANPTTGQTIIINGTTITAKTSNANAAANEFNLGGTLAQTLTNIVALINGSTDANLALVTASASATVLTISAKVFGVEGNSYTLAAGTSGATLSGANLTGGVDPTKKRVDVTMGIGTDLLSVAKELRLHPQAKAASDKSEDFIIPLAATPGALTFAYKLDSERVYNVEFMGYPDPVTQKLFSVGDPTAV